MTLFKTRSFRIIVVAAATLAAIAWSRPYPLLSTVYLGIGQKGSSYDALGQQLVPIFKENGVELVLVETTGLDESLTQLKDEKYSINAGFLTAGLQKPQRFSGLVSLGSIQYSPIWIFYRGSLQSDESEIFKKKIAIGSDGTNTQEIFRLIAQAQDINVENSNNFYKLKHGEAVQKLENGQIDAVCVVDSFDSPNVQKLLKTPGIKAFNFELADAYTRRFAFISKLTVPKGAFNIARIEPKRDINLISTTITLLVEENMHPYIQWVLIKAIKEVSNARTEFFARPDFFPAHLDRSTPLSEVAKQYYAQGFPFLANYLPLWLAVYLDRMWLIILSAIAIYSQATYVLGYFKSAVEKSKKISGL